MKFMVSTVNNKNTWRCRDWFRQLD